MQYFCTGILLFFLFSSFLSYIHVTFGIPPRTAPKAAFATSPAPIFPIGFLVIAIVWAPASIGITYGCFAALNFCGSCHLYTDRKTPAALRRRGLLRLSTSIFRYNYILFPAVLSSISLRSISVGLSPYKFSD